MKRIGTTISIAITLCTTPFNVNDSIADTIPLLVEEVDSDYLFTTLSYLTSFPDRSTYEVQEEVIAFIGAELGNAGATIQLHEYELYGQTWHNVVATVPANASLDPSEPHLVVGAHIDSVPACPGADDNASGVSAILETARVLANADLTMRVDFVFFTKEEGGHEGSEAYAADARASGEQIVAMIAVDMVGFGPANEDLDLVTKPAMAWIVEAFNEGVQTYTSLDTTLLIQESCG